MTGTVNINGVNYQVLIRDLTPADVLPVFRTDTSIVKTDSILLHAAGAEQNSAKKVLLPHLIALISNAVSENSVYVHQPYVADGTTAFPGDAGYVYSWDYAKQQYVRGAKLSIDITTLTQSQYDQLVEDLKALVTAPCGVFVGETLVLG